MIVPTPGRSSSSRDVSGGAGRSCGGHHAPVQFFLVRRRTIGRAVPVRGGHRVGDDVHLYHPRLVSIIKAEMNWQCSTDQAEEIAASIWFSLCSETYSRLRRYDPQLGGLLTYFRALSRREIWKRRRGEESPISGTPFRSQRGDRGRYRTRDRCPGIPGRPDLPGTRVLQVLSHETIMAFRPMSTLLHQPLETPKPGPEEV